jgi:hypothetical protein
MFVDVEKSTANRGVPRNPIYTRRRDMSRKALKRLQRRLVRRVRRVVWEFLVLFEIGEEQRTP